jgi:hypothetical protein
MTKEDKNILDDSIDLKTLFRLFLKRKWWFLGTLIIVLVLGMIYMWNKPIIYEVRYKFSVEDDFMPDNYLMYNDSNQLYTNDSVFIQANDVAPLFNSEIIFRALKDIEGIGDNYSDYINSYFQDLDIESGKGIFSLKVKGEDKDFAGIIAKTLIESLGTQIMNNDLEIYNNTLDMINDDISILMEKNDLYNMRISSIEEEIRNTAISSDVIDYDVLDKKGEILIYRSKIIANEDNIEKLNELYNKLDAEKANIHNRVEIFDENLNYNVENDRMINSLIVILLSFLTAILMVLLVNYIYKLKSSRKK